MGKTDAARSVKITEIHRVTIYDWMAEKLGLKDAGLYVYAAFHTAGSHGIPSVAAIVANVSKMLGIGVSTFCRVREELCGDKLLGFVDGPYGRIYYAREFLPEPAGRETAAMTQTEHECRADASEKATEAHDVGSGGTGAPVTRIEVVRDAGTDETKVSVRYTAEASELLSGAIETLEEGLAQLGAAGRVLTSDVERLGRAHGGLDAKLKGLEKRLGKTKKACRGGKK